jgi:hypothetical protein
MKPRTPRCRRHPGRLPSTDQSAEVAHPISPVLGIISLALSTVARIDLIEAFALVTGYAQNITSSILMIHTDEQRCMPIVFVRSILD